MTPSSELEPFYEQGKLLETDDDLDAYIEQAIAGLNKEGKSAQFTTEAVRAVRQGFKDATQDGYRSPSFGG